eukprot:m.153041 g.153041  ORF g.153041 m.153041 type:complete len:254 (-) comp15063_c0_seq2:1479-2240(-)
MFCYSESCSSPVWYKTLLYLRTIWLLVDYSSDILFLIEEIQGENFQESYSDAKKVESASIALLIINGIFFVISQVYMFRVKHGIIKKGLLKDVHYLERISWVEFIFTMFTFLAEDLPGVVIVIIVANATNDRNIFTFIQLGTCVAGAIFFAVRSVYECYRGRRLRREAAQATKFNKGVIKDARQAPMKDIKDKNWKAENTRKAVKALVKEPGRAKKAKKDFNKHKEEVDGIMKPSLVPALDTVVNPPQRKTEL